MTIISARTAKLLLLLTAASAMQHTQAGSPDAETGAARGSVYSAYELDIEETQADIREYGAYDPDETVANAIRAALGHNPQLSLAQSRKDAAQADRFRAFGQFLPEIEASASYTDDSWRSQTLDTLQGRDGTTVGITAVQPVFQGLSAINRYRESRARVSQSDLALMSAQLQTALEAARAHAGVVLARSIVDHRIENLSLVNRQLEIAERRQQAGAQSRTGVEQARMRRAQAQVDLGQARSNLAEREAAYSRITGRSAPVLFVPDESEIIADFSSVDQAMDAAREINPAINAAEASVKAAKHAKNAAKGDFAPRLTLEGSYFKRLGDLPLPTTQEEEYQLVARMRVPIFRQGRNIAGLRSASATVSAEQARMVSTRLSVDETVARSWRQLSEAKGRQIAAEGGIEAATHSVKGLEVEYEAGQRTVIDVLDGQRDLVQTQISLSQAEYDVRVSQYELAAATAFILDAYLPRQPE